MTTHIEIKEDGKAYVKDGDNFILCADQEQAKCYITMHLSAPITSKLKPGIYQVPVEWEKRNVSRFGLPAEVAILKESPINFQCSPTACGCRTIDDCPNRQSLVTVKWKESPKEESQEDPLDKFMDDEIAYLKSCNPLDKWGRLENQFAAGMIHAYERIKHEREYLTRNSDNK